MDEITETVAAEEVARLVAAIRKDIELDSLRLPEEYSYSSLPLCVIDAVFSIGVTYTSTRNTVARWCDSQGWARLRGPGVREVTISEFLEVASQLEADELTRAFGNRQRTSSRSGILKAQAVLRFAEVLRRFGVEALGDTMDDALNAQIEREVRLIPGQASGISFEYFLMLAGSDEYIKADRMICRYVGGALGSERAVTPPAARRLLAAAVRLLRSEGWGGTARLLDYGLWEFQRAVTR